MSWKRYATILHFLFILVAILSLVPACGHAQDNEGKPAALTLEMAERFITAAKAKAKEEGWAMSLAVVDLAGNPVALARMDGARWLTAGVAQSKAFTSVTFRRRSKDIEELAQKRPQLFDSISTLTGKPLLLAGGGLPLIIKGELLGGVGASGGTEEQDEECAKAGLAAIGAE
ncbi:MAG: heme-binding protein [Candidatus Binatia bacterium]